MDINQNSSCVSTIRLSEKVMLLPHVSPTASFFDFSLTEDDLNNILPRDPDDFKIQPKFKIRSKSKGTTKLSPKRKRTRITKLTPFTTERKKQEKEVQDSECTLRTRSTREEISDKTERSSQEKVKTISNIIEDKNKSLEALSPNLKPLEIGLKDKQRGIEAGRRTTPLRGRDVERTFDMKAVSDVMSCTIENPNRSYDVQLNAQNTTVPIEVYNILKDLNGPEQKILKEKESIPQIFLVEEKREEYQRKGKQKSETVCWQYDIKQGKGASQSKIEDLREPLVAHLGLPIVTRNYLTQMSEKQKQKMSQEKIADNKGNNPVVKTKGLMDIFSFKESFKIKKAGLLFNRKNSPFLEIKRANWDSTGKKDNLIQRIFPVKEKPVVLGELQVI